MTSVMSYDRKLNGRGKTGGGCSRGRLNAGPSLCSRSEDVEQNHNQS